MGNEPSRGVTDRPCNPEDPCETTNPVHLVAFGFCWAKEGYTVPVGPEWQDERVTEGPSEERRAAMKLYTAWCIACGWTSEDRIHLHPDPPEHYCESPVGASGRTDHGHGQ